MHVSLAEKDLNVDTFVSILHLDLYYTGWPKVDYPHATLE